MRQVDGASGREAPARRAPGGRPPTPLRPRRSLQGEHDWASFRRSRWHEFGPRSRVQAGVSNIMNNDSQYEIALLRRTYGAYASAQNDDRRSRAASEQE
jgi:hypothetical protein